MKKIIIIICFLFAGLYVNAQVPFIANTQGKKNIYVYNQIVFDKGVNTYSTMQYGLSDDIDVVGDMAIGDGYSTRGYGLRFKAISNKYFNLGSTITGNFDYTNKFKYQFTLIALYINGQIDGNLGYCSNTWYLSNNQDLIEQWTYLTYDIGNFHPMIGATFNWLNFKYADIALGASYTLGNFNVYLWGGNFINKNPRLTIGIDFKLPS